MNFLFIHGGPGLNSNPEKHLFNSESFGAGNEIYFWNEPSAKRGDGKDVLTYADACRSLKESILHLSTESKITVIAHSFGAFLLNEIIPFVEDSLERIILLSPVTDLSFLDMNILKISKEDLNLLPESKILEKYIQSMGPKDSFDDEKLAMLLIAAGNPLLTGHYWHNKECIPAYYFYMANDPYQFSLDSFKSVRRSCHRNQVSSKTDVETAIIYGRHDPFISHKDSLLLKEVYLNSAVYLFEESSHYSHIEEKNRFLDVCRGVSANLIEKADSSGYFAKA